MCEVSLVIQTSGFVCCLLFFGDTDQWLCVLSFFGDTNQWLCVLSFLVDTDQWLCVLSLFGGTDHRLCVLSFFGDTDQWICPRRAQDDFQTKVEEIMRDIEDEMEKSECEESQQLASQTFSQSSSQPTECMHTVSVRGWGWGAQNQSKNEITVTQKDGHHSYTKNADRPMSFVNSTR